MSDSPDYWVRASGLHGRAKLHYPAKFASEDEPRPLCENSIQAENWVAKGTESMVSNTGEVCRICQSIHNDTPDPRSHQKGGRKPRDILEAAGFGGESA